LGFPSRRSRWRFITVRGLPGRRIISPIRPMAWASEDMIEDGAQVVQHVLGAIVVADP